MYAKVIVDVASSNVDKIFEYGIPSDMKIALGQRVLVPFGFSNKKIEGFVLGFSSDSSYDKSKIKNIITPIEDYPAVHEDQIELAYYISDEYSCTLAESLRLMIPAQLRGSRVQEKKQQYVHLLLDDTNINDAKASLKTKSGSIRAPKQAELIDFLKTKSPAMISDVEKIISGVRSAISAMETKGWVKVLDEQIFREPFVNSKTEKKDIKLNPDQKNAVETITNNLTSGKTYLLYGITGSGKTEVYIRVINQAIKAGRGAIILVPEISLTPQAIERYRGAFSDRVALLHSRLSIGERFDQWQKIISGKCNIVLGARSAVFAPVHDLGVIIIDEEHEGSYQSDSFPRYNAISIAKKRMEKNGCVILGSATPNLETFYDAKCAKIDLLELKSRANKLPIPKVQVVDMRIELENGNRNLISNLLFDEIKEKLEKKQQIILLLNKRGYASFVMCRGCGHVLKCDHCDVALAYHKTKTDFVFCHYCGEQKPITKICPVCNKPFLKHFGVGTQQVEECVKELFPDARTLRMDHDTTTKKDAHINMFNSFMSGEYDILIGTQMIAKGLDFPNVTLVGIISADNMLNLPDYRSEEKTFSLITQAAGRAGRAQLHGNVIVQTYLPDNPTIKLALEQDYTGFFNYAIAIREKTMYPPFSTFVRILILSETYEAGLAQCKALHKDIQPLLTPIKDQVLFCSGSMSPINKIKDQYRFQVLIKLENTKKTIQWVKDLQKYYKNYKPIKNILLDFEINPKNML